MLKDIEDRLHRLSQSQLSALFLLSKSPNGIISSIETAQVVGKMGKALGGVFSSLSRQHIHDQPIVVPWGKAVNGRGLKWKLNTTLIQKDELFKVCSELLQS